MSWADDEFAAVDPGDKRLNSRLIKLYDPLSEAPERPINQACEDWHETKAAYRFFQNGNVDVGKISMKKGKNIDKIYSQGLVMHTCFAVTTERTPLGLLDQNIFERELRPDHQRRSAGGKAVHDVLPAEEKESYRWIEALEATSKVASDRTGK